MLEKLKNRAQALHTEVQTLLIAFHDPRTPWFARVMIAVVAVYFFSPIDLIPDFIPVLGYFDDLILVPAGIVLAIRMIPPQVLTESREIARQSRSSGRGFGLVSAVIIVLIWILAIIVIVSFIYHLLKEKS